MFSPSVDDEQIIARVAALDIGKAEVVCCVRLPAPGGGKRRFQEVSRHSTMTSSLTALAGHLVDVGVERVVMEATSDYWRPAFYLFEAHGLDPWLVNSRDVKHLPGRPKTDVLDAVWLCKVAERQMLRPSFVPPVESGSCETSPVTEPTWSTPVPPRRTVSRNSSRTRASSCQWWPPTSSGCQAGP